MFWVLYCFAIIYSLGVLFFFVINLLAHWSLAPWVPARRRDIKRIIDLAGLTSGQVFYELGCGDGSVTLAAGKVAGVKAVGLEINWFLYLVCRWRQLWHQDRDLIFKCCNFYKEDLSAADVVYFYGLVNKNNAVRDKLIKELRPGTKIISYQFSVPNWTPVLVSRPDKKDRSIYLYRV